MKRTIQNVTFAVALAVGAAPMFAGSNNPGSGDLANQVRHELVMIPYYNVFDDLNYSVDNATGVVTLSGEVTQPVVKQDAEGSVKHIAGVTKVVDNIRVLPLSTFDNRIRVAE